MTSVQLGAYVEGLEQGRSEMRAENERLRAAIRDAHTLIDNDLVGPWVMVHKLDDVLQLKEEGGIG